MKKQGKFIKPAQFAEKKIIKAIIKEQWKIGDKLMPERELADFLGITRPTLREVLQGLSRDGWIQIKHGRPTIINDYLNNGGLGIIKSLIKNAAFSSKDLIKDWLEFRVLILPTLGLKSIQFKEKEILEILDNPPKISATNEEFAYFDWELQLLLIKNSENSIAKMLYNDMSEIYHRESSVYFANKKTKELSLAFYSNLKNSIINDKKKIKEIIQQIMQTSLIIWEKEHKNTQAK